MDDVEGVGPPAAQVPSGSHRVLHLLGALLVGVILPAVLVGALVGELGVAAVFVGVAWGGLGAKLGGTRRMASVTPLVGIVAGLRVHRLRLVVGDFC